MRRSSSLLAFTVLAVIASTPACTAPQTNPESVVTTSPTGGSVTDLAAFDQFITTTPTPAQFRARYRDVTLVLPGDMATKELRMNKSRYFAELDGAGRITGGKFQ